MTNKITQETKEKFKAALKLYVNEQLKDEEQVNEQIDVFEKFVRLKPKLQQTFFENFAKTSKISKQNVQKYFYGDFTKEFLYQLTDEDKRILKQICAENRGKNQQEIVNIAIDVLYQQQNKKVHIESLRQAIRYYIKKTQ